MRPARSSSLLLPVLAASSMSSGELEPGIARSANAPDRRRRNAGCRTAAVSAAAGLPQIGQVRRFAFSSSLPSIIQRSPACGSDRKIKARPARRARSASASASACSARDNRGRSTQHRQAMRRRAATSAATRRKAARPAACGPASSSCSGGCTRGRTISANPMR